MRRAAAYSAGLHVAVAAVAYFGVPALLSTPSIEDQTISVDLVMLEDVTVKPTPPPKKAPPPKKEAPPPPPAAAPAPPPPPVAMPIPLPPPPKAKPKPKPKPKAKPKPKPKPEAKQPVRSVRAAPKPKRKPKRPDRLQALLKNLAKRKAAKQHVEKAKPKAEPAPKYVPAPKPARSSIDRPLKVRRLTAMVRQQLAPCWSIPGGAKDAQDMKIGVQIRLNIDGSLRGVPRVLDSFRMRSDRRRQPAHL